MIKNILVDPDTLKAEIDATENGTYVVSDGNIKFVAVPYTGHGKHTIQWANGKRLLTDSSFTEKG